MDYLEWNNLIAKYYFNETKSGKEVLLFINDELVNSLGESYNVGLEDFITSLKNGPNWATRSGFCQKAFQAFEGWRNKSMEYPPYIGYLAFFVLAAGTETDFAPQSYYPGFWKRLGDPQKSGTPPSFSLMNELWHDLEKWTREDKREELGRFVVRIRGGYSHVGLPWSQTILSEHERKLLPNFFVLSELDPTNTPTPEVLLNIIKRDGQEIFQRRTLKLLENDQNNIELKNALTEFILDELEDWDGTVQYIIPEKEGAFNTRIQTGLRICLILDSVARTVQTYLRFKTTRMFPEGGLFFQFKGNDQTWSCEEAYGGWSKPLTCYTINPPQRLDASIFNWSNKIRLIDEENHWYAGMRGANTRIFRLNIDELPHWVETQRLERRVEFLIACFGDDINKVENWGRQYCEKFEEKRFTGLSSGWKLFYGKNAKESCPGIDVLFISTTTRLLLKGGIKASGNNRYFKFAPPMIILENSLGNEKVKLNGVILNQQDADVPVWTLPNDAPIDTPIHIEVDIRDQQLRRILWLDNFNMPSSFNSPCRKKDGKISSDQLSSDYACGALVNLNEKCDSYPNSLPVHLSNRIIFIGERPGQIIDWPHESLPMDWHPVWAIANKGRTQWKVFFCGNEEQSKEEHCPGEPIQDQHKLKNWREVVWVRRRITIPPDLPQLKQIWKNYIGAAQRV